MHNRQILSLIIAVFAGLALWVTKNALRGNDQAFATGDALLPEIAICLILGLSILDFAMGWIRSLRTNRVGLPDKELDVPFSKFQLMALVIVCGLMGLFALTLRTSGYIPAAFVLLIALMVAAGGRSKTMILLCAMATSTLLYLGLRYGLGTYINAFPNLTSLGG